MFVSTNVHMFKFVLFKSCMALFNQYVSDLAPDVTISTKVHYKGTPHYSCGFADLYYKPIVVKAYTYNLVVACTYYQ